MGPGTGQEGTPSPWTGTATGQGVPPPPRHTGQGTGQGVLHPPRQNHRIIASLRVVRFFFQTYFEFHTYLHTCISFQLWFIIIHV